MSVSKMDVRLEDAELCNISIAVREQLRTIVLQCAYSGVSAPGVSMPDKSISATAADRNLIIVT